MNFAPVAIARLRDWIGSHKTFTPKGMVISGINSPITRAMAATVSVRTWVR